MLKNLTLYIFLVLTSCSSVFADESSLDSIKQALNQLHSNNAQKAELLLRAAEAELEFEMFDAENYAKQALEIASSLELPIVNAKAHLLLGDIAQKEGMFDTAVVNYNAAIYFFRLIGDEISAAKTLNKQGLIREELGDLPGAYKHYLDALKIYEAKHDNFGIASEYLNLGLINQSRNEYVSAKSFYDKALAIAKSYNYPSIEASAYNNLGMVYQLQQKYSQALNYFNIVLEMDKKSGDKLNISYSLNNVATVYSSMKNHSEALKYFIQSVEIKEEFKDYNALINGYNNIAGTYIELGKYNEALQYIQKAQTFENLYGLKNYQPETYFQLYQLHLKQGHDKKALEYYMLYSQSKDSLILKEKELAIEQLQKQYDFDKVTTQIEIQNLELQKEKTAKFYYIGALLVMLILCIVFYYGFKRIKNLNRFLNQQQQEIQTQNESLKMKNIEIAKARQFAEDAAKSKGQFLSIMSHEIRTPLNAIIGIANLMNESEMQGEQRRIFQILKTSSDNLMALINDILDISKIESGKLHLEYVDFCLKEVVKNLHDLFWHKAKEKNIDLKLNYDDRLGQKLLGDPLRLNQILSNLIGNAIKFTEKGFVEIVVRKVGDGKDYNDILFEIKDTGIGIAEEKQDTIFENFEQADKNTTRIYGGTGLGLSISKQLLEMLGSDLLLKSQVNKGSTFYFTIRFNKVHSDTPENEMEEVDIVQILQGRRILVAEDNPVNVYILKQFLSKWKMQIKVADDGIKAVELATNYNFDIVLMDINMPLLDGYAAATEILAKKPNLPIIAITATTLSETTELMKKSGIVDYVPKPFQPSELVQKILKYIPTEA